MSATRLIVQVAGDDFEPIERPFDRPSLTIGAAVGADIRIASLPDEWGVLRRMPTGVFLKRSATQRVLVELGATYEADGVRLSLRTEPLQAGTAPVRAAPPVDLAKVMSIVQARNAAAAEAKPAGPASETAERGWILEVHAPGASMVSHQVAHDRFTAGSSLTDQLRVHRWPGRWVTFKRVPRGLEVQKAKGAAQLLVVGKEIAIGDVSLRLRHGEIVQALASPAAAPSAGARPVGPAKGEAPARVQLPPMLAGLMHGMAGRARPEPPAHRLRIAMPGGQVVERLMDRPSLHVGSGPDCDVSVTGVAASWITISRAPAGIYVKRSNGRCLVPVGTTLRHDGAEISLAPPGAAPAASGAAAHGASSAAGPVRDRLPEPALPMARLAECLFEVADVGAARERVLSLLLEATSASVGALVAVEEGAARVVCSLRESEGALDQAEQLLGDPLVRAVLDGDAPTRWVPDLSADPAMLETPSRRSFGLTSVVVVPIAVGARVLGAIYLGQSGGEGGAPSGNGHVLPFEPAVIADLRTLGCLLGPRLVIAGATPSAVEPARPTPLFIPNEFSPMAVVHDAARRAAAGTDPVWLMGPPGTERHAVARAIHDLAGGGGWVSIRPGAPLELSRALEGGEGTVFIDRLEQRSADEQAELERWIRAEGTARGQRFVLGTTHDHGRVSASGRIHAPLRDAVELAIRLPSLAERVHDIVPLALLFLRELRAELGSGPERFEDAAEAYLARASWPANTEQLRATVRAAALRAPGARIGEQTLVEVSARQASSPEARRSLERTLHDAETAFARRYVRDVLNQHLGDRARAATALGITLAELYRLL